MFAGEKAQRKRTVTIHSSFLPTFLHFLMSGFHPSCLGGGRGGDQKVAVISQKRWGEIKKKAATLQALAAKNTIPFIPAPLSGTTISNHSI